MKSMPVFSLKNRIHFLIDLFIIAFSFIISSSLAFIPLNYKSVYVGILPSAIIAMAVFFVMLSCFGVYKTMWAYAGSRDYLKVVLASISATAVDVLLVSFVRFGYVEISLASCMFASAGLLLSRMAVRGVNKIGRYYHSSDGRIINVLIAGAGNTATVLIREIEGSSNLDYKIVGLVDDDLHKKNNYISGYKILGTTEDIPFLTSKYGVHEIIFAMPSATPENKSRILKICSDTGCNVKMMPGIEEIVDGQINLSMARKVKIDDILCRESIVLDNEGIYKYINDKVVFVTGGGGSIGSELCRQIMKYNPKKLVIIDIYENNAYDLQMELNRLYPENKPDVLIASIRDKERMDDIFNRYKPYLVFHAAAHKHVPLMEDSPGEAIKNNVFGTYNVARCADKHGVFRFIMISTDKAVNPTNVMGATKRMCEMIVQSMQKISKTEYVAVRFGNVLGSNGSVVPLFERQIENGGPVTVTDKRITRFFMTIPEAAQLVLQAASYASGGEIFVLDMGEPVKIYDLAVNIIKLHGLRPDVDIKIEVTGLRPGEKLYEELLMNEEGLTKTDNKKIFVGEPIFCDMDLLKNDFAELKQAVDEKNDEHIKDVLERVVPTYKRKKEDKKSSVA